VTERAGTSAADEEAIGWFVLLRDEEACAEDRARFQRWLTADPSHQRAWAGVQDLWQDLDQIGQEAAPADKNVVVLKRPTRRSPIWIAAALAALSLGLGWQMAPVGLLADHRAGVGQREIVRLEDGSEVELGSASALDVDFTAARREVTLLAGEAFFTVTPDQARPFVVHAGSGEVLVRGTAFNVKMGREIRVAVTEHTVEVSAGDSKSVSVTEGEEVSFDGSGVSPVRPADLETVQAWRQGQLVFIDAPLDSVIAELGRYRHGYIRLIGSDLGQMRVTAVFDAANPDEAIAVIARSLDLTVYRASDLLIALSRN